MIKFLIRKLMTWAFDDSLISFYNILDMANSKRLYEMDSDLKSLLKDMKNYNESVVPLTDHIVTCKDKIGDLENRIDEIERLLLNFNRNQQKEVE